MIQIPLLVLLCCRIIHPKKYYRNYLAHNIRPDGREFDAFRPIRINVKSIGTADGSSIVKLGNTTVVCGIKAVKFEFWLESEYRSFNHNWKLIDVLLSLCKNLGIGPTNSRRAGSWIFNSKYRSNTTLFTEIPAIGIERRCPGVDMQFKWNYERFQMVQFETVVHRTRETCMDSVLRYHMLGLWWQRFRCVRDCTVCCLAKL